MDSHQHNWKLFKKALTAFKNVVDSVLSRLEEQGTMYTQGQRCLWIPRPDSNEEYVVTVCGIANVGTPVLGTTYIVCFETPPPKGYSFTHAAVFERDLSTIP